MDVCHTDTILRVDNYLRLEHLRHLAVCNKLPEERWCVEVVAYGKALGAA